MIDQEHKATTLATGPDPGPQLMVAGSLSSDDVCNLRA
jgi:hypothetical protein